jgi:hypothetical protein
MTTPEPDTVTTARLPGRISTNQSKMEAGMLQTSRKRCLTKVGYANQDDAVAQYENDDCVCDWNARINQAIEDEGKK